MYFWLDLVPAFVFDVDLLLADRQPPASLTLRGRGPLPDPFDRAFGDHVALIAFGTSVIHVLKQVENNQMTL